jgi:hypothetical protein
MADPIKTAQAQRMNALRTRRSELKARIRRGEVSPWPVLEGESDIAEAEKLVRSMRVFDFIKNIPGIGEPTAVEAMAQLGLTHLHRLQGCTFEQRKDLSTLLREVLEVT